MMEPNKFFFGDGEHAFAFDLATIETLERETDTGVPALVRGFLGSDYRATDLKNTIRLGLIGGGMDPEAAAKLVENYFLAHGLERCRIIAALALSALFGPSDEGDEEMAI